LFLNNKELLKDLKEYFDGDKKEIAEKIYKKVDMIIHRYSTHRKFFKYTYRDQMISEARIHCFKSIKKFNTELYDNPLAYFTMVAHNAFIQVINKEKREVNIKNDLIDVKLMEKFNPKQTHVKVTDVNIPSINNTFNPIKITKNGVTVIYKTKIEHEKHILDTLINKYGFERGTEKFEIHRQI